MTISDTLRQLGLTSPDPRSDGELVGQFVAVRDEAAFAELLRRHGPTVYGVCRRVLGNAPDADDAFQAVFLVLARKANAIRPTGMVGHWLHGVAVRTAHKARVMNAKRAKREGTPHPPGAVDRTAPGGCGVPSRDTLALIDAELTALPDVYRAAFVTCELNGRSRSEASRELGWPEGTVAARLAKARELLAARLRRRGVTLGVGLFPAVAVPAATATETMSAVRELLAVGTASAVAPTAQLLSDEVTKTMHPFNVRWIFLAGFVLALATGGAVLLAAPEDKRPTREAINTPVSKVADTEWKEADPITFEDGGRVTSIAFAPSRKTFAVCRAGGQIDFFDPATRKHQQSMNFLGDPKSNPKREGATYPALAFRPTPHAKLGDVFAITHKNGVNFGTTNIGLLVDDAPAVEDLPGNSENRNFDPRQVAWLADDSMVATNGAEVWWRVKVKDGWESQDWTQQGERGRQVPFAALPGQALNFVTVGVGRQKESELQIVARAPQSSPQTRLEGHKGRPVAAAVSADGKRIVSVDEVGALIVWEGEKLEFKEKRRVELGNGVVQLALAADGKTVAAVRAYSDTTLLGTSGRTLFNLELFVFDVTDPPAKPKPLWSVRNVLSDAKTFTCPVSLAFSLDGKTLLAAFADPYIEPRPKERGGEAKSMGVRVWELVPKK